LEYPFLKKFIHSDILDNLYKIIFY